MTHANHKYAILEGEARKTILQQLKNEKLHRQQTFNKFFQQNNNATEATYKVAYILGKWGKPFSDVEMIKECIVEVVKCLHPEKTLASGVLRRSWSAFARRGCCLRQGIHGSRRHGHEACSWGGLYGLLPKPAPILRMEASGMSPVQADSAGTQFGLSCGFGDFISLFISNDAAMTPDPAELNIVQSIESCLAVGSNDKVLSRHDPNRSGGIKNGQKFRLEGGTAVVEFKFQWWIGRWEHRCCANPIG
ncbi:EPM2AIP1 [Cordylochernes scorpioides]|uniref:EPM2AIP1 n=1 Tax=Cordylochernes scorpioides TaxID=51811 RepID=A0ABY6L516_9ARAC|nr:EPM2AIP1 [Cordylochernes scorpioides]